MPKLQTSHGVELESESLGDPRDPAVVLVMGLGAQLIHWPTEFCDLLVARGLRVVRFDNRDAGLSTKLEGEGRPPIPRLIVRRVLGRSVEAPYAVDDMAEDLLGLLDALGIERAHLVGASMGGMIAQAAALARPDRVASLVSLMSGTGDLIVSRPRAVRALLAPAAPGREGAIERSMTLFEALRGPRFPLDADACRRIAGLAYDRAYYPAGFPRQLAAVLAAPSRTRALASLEGLPTLVIHGTADPLVPASAGRATAKAIPGARLHLIEGMGHHLPLGAWPELTTAIAEHVLGAARREAPDPAVSAA